jgi:hypothetical protein
MKKKVAIIGAGSRQEELRHAEDPDYEVALIVDRKRKRLALAKDLGMVNQVTGKPRSLIQY